MQIPSFALRGLSNLDWLSNVIGKAVVDETIGWEDIKLFDGQIRDALWMCFSGKCEDINVWEDCLNSPFPTKGPSIYWLQWIGEYVFYRTLLWRPTTLRDVVKVHENCQHQTGIITPITLISAFLKLVLKDPIKCLACAPIFLEILSEVDAGKIDKDWLVGTLKWSNTFDAENDKSTDLLLEFAKLINGWLQAGDLKHDEVIDRGIESVRGLIELRENLMKEWQ